MACLRFLPAVALVLSGPALAATCPEREPGATYPWQIQDQLPGDQYAHLYIEVDEKGHPIKCSFGKSNIPRDDRFWVCKAYMDDWHVPPVMRNGKPVRSVIERDLTLIGDKHAKANRDARKAWFRAHPEENPGCYPE